MLKKILLSLLMVGVSFLTGYATAQSYFLNNPPAPASNGAGVSDQSNANTMSPTDFQSQTQEMQKKKDEAMSNQMKQELSKVPATPPPAAAATPAESAPSSEGQAAAPESSSPTNSAAPAATAGSAAPDTMQESGPTGPTPAAPPVSAPSQSQVYTGFQNGNTAAPNPKQSQPANSGNLNIKY